MGCWRVKPGPTPTISVEDKCLPVYPPMMTSWPALVSQLTWSHLLCMFAWLVQVEVPGAQTIQEVTVLGLPPPQTTMPAGVRSAGEKLQCRAGRGRAVLPAEW